MVFKCEFILKIFIKIQFFFKKKTFANIVDIKLLLEMSSSQENENPGYFRGCNLLKSFMKTLKKSFISLSWKLYSFLFMS